jgi:hypothetical protein
MEFLFLFLNVLEKFSSSETSNIYTHSNKNSKKKPRNPIQDNMNISSKEGPQNNHYSSPKARSNDIISPEEAVFHMKRSRKKRNKSTCEVMEFPENDKQRAIFLNTGRKDFLLGLSESKD